MIPREDPSLGLPLSPPAPDPDPHSGPQPPAVAARTLLLVSAALTLVLFLLPFGSLLARPFVLLSTVAHEMGHGLTALLVGGGFQRLAMWPNGAGVAEVDISHLDRLRQALAIAGGLVGPAVAAALFFALGRTGRGARACLFGLGALLVAAEVLVVRNAFGLMFIGLVAAACLFAASRGPTTAQLAVVFVAVQLALSVFSRADYLFTREVSNPNGRYPSDVEQIARLLWLPYWLWGALCGAVAVTVLAWGLRIYWKR